MTGGEASNESCGVHISVPKRIDTSRVAENMTNEGPRESKSITSDYEYQCARHKSFSTPDMSPNQLKFLIRLNCDLL